MARKQSLFSRLLIVPWDPIFEADGVTPYNPYKSGMWYSNNKANYFFDSQHYSDNTKELNFNTDLQLDVKVTDWMTFSTSNRFGFSGSDQKQLLDKSHFSASFENGRITQTTSYNNNILTSNLLKMRRSYGNNTFELFWVMSIIIYPITIQQPLEKIYLLD